MRRALDVVAFIAAGIYLVLFYGTLVAFPIGLVVWAFMSPGDFFNYLAWCAVGGSVIAFLIWGAVRSEMLD